MRTNVLDSDGLESSTQRLTISFSKANCITNVICKQIVQKAKFFALHFKMSQEKSRK